MHDIRLSDLPKVNDRESILLFAQSFNGYAHFGSFEACAEAANRKSRLTLVDLRNELFFSYRASNHLGTDDFVKTYEKLYPLFVELLEDR